MCIFDVEDEGAAFAYAEERVRASGSRLAVSNKASEREGRVFQLIGRAEFGEALRALMHEQFRLVDRRAMSGDPFSGRETSLTNLHRLLADYPAIEFVPLAVRGDRLVLAEWRCRNPNGYEAVYLNVDEFDERGLLVEQVRFDEHDFDGAYRELERRYYAGEGAAFAEAGAVSTEVVLALNGGEIDRFFDELVAPEFRTQNRSRALFTDLSATEFRTTLLDLRAMVASVRVRSAVVCWLSPTWVVGRFEREAIGRDGEQYAWSMLLVTEVRAGRMTSMCLFELDDEEAAFAYAEERSKEPPQP
jgi:hypothetical protein